MIDLVRARNVGKMDDKGLPCYHFFHREDHLGAQIKMCWLQCQGLVQLSPDFNGSCRCLSRPPKQIDVPAGHIDGHFDKCRNTEDFNFTGRIVGVDFGGFGDLPLVIFGFHL